ncbi:MAG TPA: ABC transporter ATP-binding protein [Candidatus Woesebacteria bacterium]|nr:ABC transporter ATP-binding protein [Candidatus Woesebacteria bacterium]
MDSKPNYTIKEFIADLIQYIRPYRKMFLTGAFFRLTSDISRLYPAFAVSQIVPLLTVLHEPGTVTRISILLGVWLVLSIYFGITHDYSKYLGYQVAERAGLDLYKKSLAHIFKLDLAWHELEGSGNKMKRIDRGYEGMNQSIRRIFDVFIEVVVNIVGIVLIFFTLQSVLSLSIIFFVVTYFVIGRYLLIKATRQERIVNKKVEELSGLTFESLNNILTIKSLAFNKGIVSIVGNHILLLVEEIRKRIFYYRIQSGVLNVYYFTFEIVMVSFIVWQIWLGNYEVSLLLLFIGLYQKVGESTDELIRVMQEMVVNKIWVSRAIDLLRVEPIIENPKLDGEFMPYPQNWEKLSVQNVHFGYKKGRALTNINFDIQRGESVGIVGLSGAGKSTLFKLLLDLYEDYDGDILLDTTPLKKIKREEYIDHVSVVLQDTELFNVTLKENISIVSARPKPQEVLYESIKMAHLTDVVKKLGNGLETIVGEKGIKLSGGQRQRVGIARALYRQPDILLMDEATSHLDAYSEKQIQEAITDVKGKFTIIVIAHRLSTIQQMDKIIVLEKGKIKEMGTFTELLKKDGSFAKMWKLQKL